MTATAQPRTLWDRLTGWMPGRGLPSHDVGGDPRRSEYAAATESKKRRTVPIAERSEDKELTPEKRSKVITLGRDLRRNIAIAGWAIRKHLDYVAKFNFQGTTGDDKIDDPLEAFVRRMSAKDQWDVRRRHPLSRWLRISEAARTVDGDMLVMKLASRRVQAIEADRIRNLGPATTDEWCHGVKTDAAGADLAYCIGRRRRWGGFEFERIVNAQNALLYGYFDRHDQVRGISPLAAAMNPYQDIWEATDLALAKMKVSQFFALSIFSNRPDPVGVTVPSVGRDTDDEEEEGEDEEVETSADGHYDVQLGDGPAKIELEENDRAEFLESRSPSTEFQAFMQTVIAIALKALDIPFNFYDESHTNYSGGRQALLMYEESAESKRFDNRELLDHLCRWRFAMAIADGDLVLPRGVTIDDLRWEWVSTGIPWIDPLKEVNADTQARNAGFDSTVRVCKRGGGDAYQLADEEAKYQAYRASKGLPNSLVQPGSVTVNEVNNAA